MPKLTAVLAAMMFTGAAIAAEPDLSILQNTDIFQLEVATDPQISPDGAHVAYVRRSMDIMTDMPRSNIWVVSVDGGDHRPLLSGKANYSSPRWSPSGDRLAYISGAEGGKPQLYVRWMDTGQTALLSNLTQAPGAIEWSGDGATIAFSMFVERKAEPLAKAPKKPKGAKWAKPVIVIEEINYRSNGAGYNKPGNTHIFTLPADGGTPRQLTTGAFNHGGMLSWSPDSATILFSANRNEGWALDPVESGIWAISVADKTLRKLTSRDGPDFSPKISPDGARIAYLGFDDKRLGFHTAHVHVMNADGTGASVLTGNLDRSVSAIGWAGNDALIAQYDDKGRTYLARVTLDGQVTPLVRDVGGVAMGRPYTSGSFTVNDDGAIAYTSGRPNRPADVAAMPAGGRAIRVTRLNDDLFADKTLGEVEAISWTSSVADKREIQGWIVKPPNFDAARKYPFILEIHGGPFAAYGPHFAAEIQLYAAAGYVVLYANPRGSTSYGDAFANLIHHDYPGNDYDDLMSGVDDVVARGYVDPDNLFVTGGSGGGVLAAWIIGKTNRFRAAVVAKPVINWISFALTADAYPFFYRYWFDKAPWEDPDAYWARSPLSLVGAVTTPTMLITGEADYRTPISESEQYYQALKLRGVDAAMVRVPNASHLIAGRPSNLIAKADNIIAWFERYRTETENTPDDAQ